MGVDDQGRLSTTKQNFQVAHLTGPIMQGGVNAWQLTADLLGRVVSTKIKVPNILSPLDYIPMSSPGGIPFKVVFRDNIQRLVTQGTSGRLIDVIPLQPDVAMSRWPDSIGVSCPSCNNATISVSADLSCWCCVCSTFVIPEDTTITVILEE